MPATLRLSTAFLIVCALLTAPALPACAASDGEIAQLRAVLDAQQKLLDSQRQTLAEQQRQLAAQETELQQHRTRLESLTELSTSRLSLLRGTGGPDKADAERVASVAPSAGGAPAPRPEVAALPDVGGVLTPRGQLTFENSIDYANTTRNQFTFNGVQVSEVVLVGQINNFTARRQLLQYAGRLRLGITDRLEADVRVPYVYRNDATALYDTGTGTTTRNTLTGNDLGDIDMGLAYQFNNGTGSWPYLVGNLRFKADNADGPYDVPYDSSNIATRLPVGSGFKSGEVSLTAIKLSDPAVIYGNIGYVYTHGEDVNKDFGTTRITSVEPGDAINASFGLGFAINPDLSLSFGYKHSYVFPTEEQTLNLVTSARGHVRSDTQQVGAVSTGASYRLSDSTSINLNVEAGVTSDAPDVRVGVRVPIRLGSLF